MDRLAQREAEVILDQQADLAFPGTLDQKVRMGTAGLGREPGNLLCYSSFSNTAFALT